MCDDAVVTWSYVLRDWKGKESIGIFPIKQIPQNIKRPCLGVVKKTARLRCSSACGNVVNVVVA